MSQGRRGIKTLGLLLLASLSVMAVTAAAAQAGEFRVAGKTFTAAKVTEKAVVGTVAAGELLVEPLGLKIHCTGGTVSGTVKVGGTAKATVLYSGCEVLGNKFCKTYETEADMKAETNAGNLVAEGEGELVLNGTTHYLKVKSGAKPFATVYLTSVAKGCNLPLENTVTGSAAFKLPTALSEETTQTLEDIDAVTEGVLGVALKYGNESAVLDEGNASVKLVSGEKWGGE